MKSFFDLCKIYNWFALLHLVIIGWIILAAVDAASPVKTPMLIEPSSILDEGYRLRRVSEPLTYDLYLDISDENFYSYNGSVDIEMRYLDSMNYFYLNNAGVVIDRASIKVTKPNGEDLPLANLIHMDKYEQMYFGFAERLEQNGIYKVHIEFSNNIGTDLKGLYRSSYTVGNSTRYIATTHFESTYARTVFPCYDEPSFKAFFNIVVRHRSPYHALSNMPVKQTEKDDKQLTITRFETSPFMSTYLLAIIVSDYTTLSAEEDHIKVYAPENQVQHTRYAADFAKKSLNYLEELFGHSFQLPKVDLIAIPDFNMGAMENWGLITFRAIYLIYDEETTTARTKQNIADLITHEFVHSWFGNEVTPEWWTYLWLSEGFARYFEYYVTAQIEETWKLWDQFVVNNVHAAFSQDDKSSNRPMSYYATEPDVLNDLFDYVVYAKSASVIRMMQNVIGFDVLKIALNDYIASRSYQTTKPEYLYASIEKFNKAAIPGTIMQVFNSWADNAGYPVVVVERQGDLVTLTQKRFWMPIEGETPPPDTKYYIPLNYATSSEANFHETIAVDWLTPEVPQITKTISSSDEWILVNKQQTGYYRVRYDNNNWAALTAVLNSENMETIPVINRAQLIDDVSNLAKAGEVSYNVALSLLQYLERETEYITWSTAYNALNHLNRMFSSNENYSRFEDFMRTVTGCIYENVRMTGLTNHISRLHRGNTVYLACFFGVKSCIDDAQKLVQQMLDNKSYVVPEEVQPAAFCAINKYEQTLQGDLLKELFERYLPIKDDDSGLITRFIAAMGCSRNVSTIGFYLGLTISNLPGFQLTGTERNLMLAGVLSGSYEGLRESLKFVLENYPDVSYLYMPLNGIFADFGNRVNSKETLELLEEIVAKYGNVFSDSLKTAASEALYQATQNVAWATKHSEIIGDWLVANDYVLSTTTFAPPGRGGASSTMAGLLLTTLVIVINVVIAV